MKAARRFQHFATIRDRAPGLAAGHPAATEGRTIFPTAVVGASSAPRCLVKGSTQRKLGDRVTKGAWKGMPIYALTLEERATCPGTCHHWTTCYGNGMPMARRHIADDDLIYWLDRELEQLNREYPRGFVVRLHVLGDFFSVVYVQQWGKWLRRFPALRVFGYSAWPANTPIGAAVDALAVGWTRFAVRRSVPKSAPKAPRQAATVNASDTVALGIVCPAQTGKTDCCGTCGLCWAPAAQAHRIAFISHGGLGAARGADRRPRAARGHPSIRQGAILELARVAAAEGRQMPTNAEIAAALSYSSTGHASLDLTALEKRGLVRVERFNRGRIVTIVATGARTATPENTTPHWRLTRSAA